MMDEYWLICYIESILSKTTVNRRVFNTVHHGPLWKWFEQEREAQESCKKHEEESGWRTVRNFVLINASRISEDDYGEFKAREDDGFLDNCVDFWIKDATTATGQKDE